MVLVLDELYMFVKLKSYDYLQNGRTTLLVLHQCDNRRYKANDIARKDNISMPFKDDRNILGKWKSVAVVQNKEALNCFLRKSSFCQRENAPAFTEMKQ